MPSILDYYDYAKLATAAYVILDGEPLTGQRIAALADSEEQKRIPIKLAEQMFVADPNSNPYVWTIPTDGYHGNGDSGFAATLFARTDALGVTEKVVAIRGTEPTGSKLDPASQFSLDLMTADLIKGAVVDLFSGEPVVNGQLQLRMVERISGAMVEFLRGIGGRLRAKGAINNYGVFDTRREFASKHMKTQIPKYRRPRQRLPPSLQPACYGLRSAHAAEHDGSRGPVVLIWRLPFRADSARHHRNTQ